MRYLPALLAILLLATGCQEQAPEVTKSGPALLASTINGASDERIAKIDYNWNSAIDGQEGDYTGEESALPTGGIAAVPSAPMAETHVIDFETPPLGPATGTLVINPYIDEATGTVFSTIPGRVVGLVKNSNTSVCVDPPGSNQKLATGAGNVIGLSGFPVHVSFPDPLTPPCRVSVDVQILINSDVRLTLVAPDGGTTMVVARALTADGNCGYPGGNRSRVTVSATSDSPVDEVIIQGPGGRVFVIDDFTFEYNPVSLALDIRPGSCRNPLNRASNGVLPVALLGTGDTDVRDIDVSTILLAGVAPLRSRIDDVSGPGTGGECACPTGVADGTDDLVMHFHSAEVFEALGDIVAGETVVVEVSGMLLDGRPFTARDCVVVVGRDVSPVVGDGTRVNVR